MSDLRVLNEYVMQLKFKMLTLRQIVSQIRSEDWFVTIDLKDAYFQMSMSQEVPEVRFWGQSIPVSGSSVQPSIITPHFHEMRRCSPGTSSASGYSHYELYRRLVDFSSVASVGSSASRCRSCQHGKLGLRLKRQEKCAFSFTEDHFPGRDMGLNVDAGAPVTGTFRVHPVGCGKNKARPVTHSQTVSETVRSYGSSIQGDTFGLLHMRPLQWWLRTKGFSPRGNPFCMIKVTRRCLRDLVMWKKPWFLSQGPMLGASCRRKMLTTDASLMGWGAISEGRSSQGLWKDHHLSWHINRLICWLYFLLSRIS